ARCTVTRPPLRWGHGRPRAPRRRATPPPDPSRDGEPRPARCRASGGHARGAGRSRDRVDGAEPSGGTFARRPPGNRRELHPDQTETPNTGLAQSQIWGRDRRRATYSGTVPQVLRTARRPHVASGRTRWRRSLPTNAHKDEAAHGGLGAVIAVSC